MVVKAWTDDHVETLKRLWDEGLSCAQIANEMKCGFTRNAIIGKIHRLGLNGRVYAKCKKTPEEAEAARALKTEYKRDYRAKQRSISQPAKPSRPVRPDVCLEVTPRKLDLCDLGPGECHWPYGDGPFTFCGHTVLHGAYCASHYFASVGPGTAPPRVDGKAAVAQVLA